MITEPLRFSRLALRLFPIVCLLLISDHALAQSAAKYCEPPPAVKAELDKVTKVNDEELPFKARLERQKSMLQELLTKHPDSFHVQRRYQDNRRAGFFADTDALLADYRGQMEKKPNDPIAVYLYNRLLIGRNTKEAIALAEKLTQQAPDFPWTHLQLAEIYNYPSFRDVAKTKEHLKHWMAKCPGETASLSLISRFAD